MASGTLLVTDDTLKVANLIRHPPKDVPWRPVLRLISRWAVGTLPVRMRRDYGLRWGPLDQLQLHGGVRSLKLIRPFLPSQIREVFPARQAARRMAGVMH